jgi:hypothetical protein
LLLHLSKLLLRIFQFLDMKPNFPYPIPYTEKVKPITHLAIAPHCTAAKSVCSAIYLLLQSFFFHCVSKTKLFYEIQLFHFEVKNTSGKNLLFRICIKLIEKFCMYNTFFHNSYSTLSLQFSSCPSQKLLLLFV